MTLESDVTSIKKDVENIKDAVNPSFGCGIRVPIATMLTIVAIHSCTGTDSTRHEKIMKELNEQRATQELHHNELRNAITHRDIRTQNVILGEAPEKYIEINGQRAYIEIDGAPIASYINTLERE